MFDWEFETREDTMSRLHKLALETISGIVLNDTPENPDREIRYERVVGALFLLSEIQGDILATAPKKDEPSAKEAMDGMRNAVENLFSRDSWKKVEADDGTDT